MDLALTIFNVGAGLGVLAAGAALVYLAWQLTPLIRDSRALTADLRRLARTTDAELRPILAQARELTTDAEVLTEDVAVKLERLGDIMTALQTQVEARRIGLPAQRASAGSVESSHAREDASDA